MPPFTKRQELLFLPFLVTIHLGDRIEYPSQQNLPYLLDVESNNDQFAPHEDPLEESRDERNTFPTKTGYCRVLEDRIEIVRSGALGTVTQSVYGNKISRSILIYSIASVFMGYIAYDAYRNESWVSMGFSLTFSILFAIVAFNARKNSAAPVVPRSAIERVVFKKAIPGLTRSHILVHFKNEKGKMKKRVIMLPGSMTGGPEATSRALEILKREGLY